METPKKEIQKLEAKAKKASIYAKNHPIRNDDDGDTINPFPGHEFDRPSKLETNQPFNKIVKEASSGYGGEYNGPIELGMKKWKKSNLAPFTEFVDTEINHKKIKSTTKNNIKRVVGMWEKGQDDSYNMDTHNVHTINEWKYEEAPILTEDLAVWFGTKKKPKGSKQPKGPWVNICRKVDGKHPPCGRSEADTKGYPKCRAAGVAGKMSTSQKQAACAQKRRAEKKDPKIGTGNKPTMTSYKPKKLNENIELPNFKVKDYFISVGNMTYKLAGSDLKLWVKVESIQKKPNGELEIHYWKPPLYLKKEIDTIPIDKVKEIVSKLGQKEIKIVPKNPEKPNIYLIKIN